MPLEIEAKMSVPDFAALLRRLKSAGAKPIGEREETNVFFDTPDAALRRADKGLRLRTHRDVKTGRVEHVVTFKGPRRPGPLKSRPEFEFVVDEPANVRQVFFGLGLEVSIQFKKHRQSWRLEGCRIELDELPGLGKFVEIEGPRSQGILKIRRALGLEDSPLIRESYAALVGQLRRGGRGVR